MKAKLVKQKTLNDCGVACMSMLIEHHQNKKVLVEEIKYKFNFDNNSLSFFDLINIGQKYELKGEGYSCDFELLNEHQQKCPFICQVKNTQGATHFVIIVNITNKDFIVADPSENRLQKIAYQDFAESYLGNILFFHKLKKNLVKSKSSLPRFIFSHFFHWFFLIGTVSLMINFLTLYNASFIRTFAQWFNDPSTINKDMLLFCLITGLIFCLEISKYSLIIKLNEKIYQLILLKTIIYFSQIDNEDYLNFSNERKKEFIDYQLNYSLGISKFYFNCLGLIIYSGICIYLISLISILILLITFAIITIMILNNLIFKIYFHHRKYKFMMMNHKVYNSLNQILLKMSTIKQTNFSKTMTQLQEDISQRDQIVFFEALGHNYLQKSFNFFSRILYFTMMLITYFLILKGQMDYAILIYLSILNSYLVAGFIESFELCWTLYLNVEGKNIFSLVNDFQPEKYESFNETIKTICIQNLTKKFNNFEVINDLNLKIDNSAFIQVKSGDGSDFVLKLIGKKLNKYSGQIKINSTEIKYISEQELNTKAIYLDDNPMLIEHTVLNCIVGDQQIDNKLFVELDLVNILISSHINFGQDINTLSKSQQQIVQFLNLFFINKQLYLFNNPLSLIESNLRINLMQKFFELKKDCLLIYSSPNNDVEHLFAKTIVWN